MAYSNTPVKIPTVPGKITYRKRTDKVYVLYEIGRVYNPARKTTTAQRKMIGMQIRNAPTLMLPNENYDQFFENGVEKMTAKERKTAQDYEAIRGEYKILNSLFDQLYYEFQIQAHRSPHRVVNTFKIRRINKILEPLKKLMADEPYAGYLELPEEPETIPGKEGEEDKLEGLDFSGVALVLTQFKGAMTRFSADCL